MFHLVHATISAPDASLTAVSLRLDRQKLAKRLWRGVADDGMEFGVELERPLQPGETVFQTESSRYVIFQEEEAVLEISLDLLPPSAAAGVGWAIGNLHVELTSEPTRLLTPDEKAVRQLLDRIGVPFRETRAVFRPGRFSRGAPAASVDPCPHELGPSHKH